MTASWPASAATWPPPARPPPRTSPSATACTSSARVLAAPDGRLAVNTTGNDGMAKGGSGDVLTGLLASLLAQGTEPFAACCAAVWLHGRAGDLATMEKGHRGMTPVDMIEKLPYALKEVE